MFIFQAIIFTIVFCFFTIYKDYIVNTYYREIDEKKLNYINRRFIISYVIGLILLFIFYYEWKKYFILVQHGVVHVRH